MTAAAIAALQFVSVFALGLQSRNVNTGHVALAILTSFVISATSLASLWLTLVRPEQLDPLSIVGFMAGSAAGIAAAIKAHGPIARAYARLTQRTSRAATPRGSVSEHDAEWT